MGRRKPGDFVTGAESMSAGRETRLPEHPEISGNIPNHPAEWTHCIEMRIQPVKATTNVYMVFQTWYTLICVAILLRSCFSKMKCAFKAESEEDL